MDNTLAFPTFGRWVAQRSVLTMATASTAVPERAAGTGLTPHQGADTALVSGRERELAVRAGAEVGMPAPATRGLGWSQTVSQRLPASPRLPPRPPTASNYRGSSWFACHLESTEPKTGLVSIPCSSVGRMELGTKMLVTPGH